MIDFGQLQGKTVAVTGASSGIGRETAILLASLGANLALGARGDDELRSLAAGFHTPTLTAALDVTDEASVKSFSQAAISRFGTIDALIQCAGTGVFESFLSLRTEDFDRMVTVNLKGTFLCGKYFAAHMADKAAGQILNVISIAGSAALPGCAGYSASKFGVLGLTRVMQAELRAKGVRVTAVLPGAVATPFWEGMDEKPDLASMIPVQSLARHLIYLLCQPEGAVVDEMTVMPPLGIL